MPDVMITIGGRQFSVSCQDGEEHYLRAAAEMLNTEASALTAQIGTLPEARMLLMSGLMLADKTAGAEDKLKELRDQIATLESEIETLKSAGSSQPERIEVPVVPAEALEAMADLAGRAEAIASKAAGAPSEA